MTQRVAEDRGLKQVLERNCICRGLKEGEKENFFDDRMKMSVEKKGRKAERK